MYIFFFSQKSVLFLIIENTRGCCLLTEAEKPEVMVIERMVMGSEEFTREITDGLVLLG